MAISSKRITINLLLIAAVASIPIIEKFVPLGLHISDPMTDVFVYAILGLGLNILTGFTGLLNLGVAAFAAIGAYVFAIVLFVFVFALVALVALVALRCSIRNMLSSIYIDLNIQFL